MISRRRYLYMASSLLAWILPLTGCTGRSESSPAEKMLADLLPLIPDEPVIATAAIKENPEYGSESLKDLLQSLEITATPYHNSDELMSLINDRIKEDYRRRDILEISGWQLSRTEVRLICARSRILH